MSKYGYEELQLLYEDGFRGQASDISPNNSQYGYTSDPKYSSQWAGFGRGRAASEQPTLDTTMSNTTPIDQSEEEVIHVKHLQPILDQCFEDETANKEHLWLIANTIKNHKKLLSKLNNEI